MSIELESDSGLKKKCFEVLLKIFWKLKKLKPEIKKGRYHLFKIIFQ